MSQPAYLKFDHDQHARSKDETDFWGQIRRTVNGKPVDDIQIKMIVDAINEKLDFRCDDVLLDLACGNGALSSKLFDSISGYRGVDFSASLVAVANKYFEKNGSYTFVHSGASEYVDAEDNPLRYTKALCYGSFSYFSQQHAANVLQQLNKKFTNINRVFIGNLPDRAKADKFYMGGKLTTAELDDNESAIGIWRNEKEFIELAEKHGWKASISFMPETYYASHYRYDVLLTR